MIREFPKIRSTLSWGPYNKDPTIGGTIFGSPIFGNSHTDADVPATPVEPHVPIRESVRGPHSGDIVSPRAQATAPTVTTPFYAC